MRDGSDLPYLHSFSVGVGPSIVSRSGYLERASAMTSDVGNTKTGIGRLNTPTLISTIVRVLGSSILMRQVSTSNPLSW